jgi:hypothetical protein
MRPIDADVLVVELQKDEALFDNEAVVARENSIKYTDNYAKIMWSRANGIRDAIVEVYDAPTIDVNRPTGEWIVDISDYKSMCSVCGTNETHFIYGTEMWYGLGKSNFCPYCGADMREREGK